MLGIKEFDTIVIARPRNVFGVLIRLFTRSKYDHTASVIKHPETGRLMICEAKAFGKTNGYNITITLFEFLRQCETGKRKALFLRNPNPPADRKKRFEEIQGNSYGYISIVFFHILKILTGFWFGEKNPKHPVCSEADMYINAEPKFYEMTPKECSQLSYQFVTSVGFYNFTPLYNV